MVLDLSIKQGVESAIKNWCPNVTMLKKGEARLKKVWKFENSPDFIYGYLVGQMEGYIAGFIVGKYGKVPTTEENREIRKMVEIRAIEIRNVMLGKDKSALK